MKFPSYPLLATLALVLAVQAPARAQAARPPAKAAPAPRGPVVIQSAPGGDTIAVLPPGASVQAVGREGEWTRVRVEGWTRSPVPGAPAPSALTPSQLRAEPSAHRGKQVAWSARFLALQRADAVRADFAPGELFILARDPSDEVGFVYIAVTPQQAVAARRLLPMQRFNFVGRVRTGASPQMGHPVLDLVELRP